MIFATDKEVPRDAKTLVYMLKTLYAIFLFLVGLGILMKFVIPPTETITLRDFPYPYKAGLAISNNIKGTDSREEFVAVQKYLCTEQTTPWGRGLGLEVGNSFCFYDFSGKSNFIVFDTTDSLNEETAALLTEFIESGYIDAMNTYGNFGQGEFNPIYAEKALIFMHEHGLSIPIWINNTNPNDRQNLGRMVNQSGDNPEHLYYHAYLLPDFGIRYIELGGYTNVVGQEAASNINRWFKKAYEFVISVWHSTRAKRLDLDWNNRLINPYHLDDNQRFLRFRRFINIRGHAPFKELDVSHTALQLESQILNRLTEMGGYTIVCTCLGSNDAYSEWIPESVRKALRGLANRFRGGQILVTTISRLLDYYIVHQFLKWEWSKSEGEYVINILGIEPPIELGFEVDEDMLQGLTFYTPDPENTRIFFKGEIVSPLEVNEPDESGMGSVSIPWKWLTFPQGY